VHGIVARCIACMSGTEHRRDVARWRTRTLLSMSDAATRELLSSFIACAAATNAGEELPVLKRSQPYFSRETRRV
jgi:hypothetical protein